MRFACRLSLAQLHLVSWLACASLACGDTAPPPGGHAGEGGGGGAATCTSTGVQPGARNSTSADWCRVDELLDEAFAGGADARLAPGYSLQVFALDGGKVALQYERAAGTAPPLTAAGDESPMTPATTVRVASATKLITGLTTLRAIQALRQTTGSSDYLSLDSQLSALGCEGIAAAAAQTPLRAVMHQIAGLGPKDTTCLKNGGTIQSCACEILHSASPGTNGRYTASLAGSFVYGSPNFTVMAAMVEVALAKGGITDDGAPMAWRIWHERFAAELGIEAAASRYGIGDQSLAGGLAIAGETYAKFLALALPGASFTDSEGRPLLDASDLAAMATPFGDGVPITFSPFQYFTGSDTYPIEARYGLASWVMCMKPWPTPEQWPADPPKGDYSFLELDYATCPKKIQHSEGKFGFLPWLAFDTEGASNAHIAVLATDKSELPQGEGKVSQDTFDVFLEIEPYLDRVLR